jgi:hypothetical protein
MGAPDQVAPQHAATVAVPYRVQLLQRATARIPLTNEGLPVGYYRTDLLPIAYIPEEKLSEILRGSFLDLNYDNGYPQLGDGRPFWFKLEFEPGFAYGAFQIYLESISGGPRDLTGLSHNAELLKLGEQMFPNDAFDQERLYRLLHEYSILYYWRYRSRAHDIYKDAAYRHTRLRRQMSMEDYHYTTAESLLAELKEKVLSKSDFFDRMSPKVALDMLTKLVTIQRISVGLPAQGPLSQKETPEDTTFEMIMRTLGSKAAEGATYDQSGNAVAARGALKEVLNDPVSAKNLQEVIIRVTKAHRESLPSPHQNFEGRRFAGRPGKPRTQEIITADDLTGGLDVSDAPGADLDAANVQGVANS